MQIWPNEPKFCQSYQPDENGGPRQATRPRNSSTCRSFPPRSDGSRQEQSRKMQTAGDVSAAGSAFKIRRSNLYLMLLRFVAKDSLATKAASHQLEPSPPGFKLVMFDVLKVEV